VREVRIYQSGTYQVGSSVVLSAEASLHIAVVLRMQLGHKITLFPGDNHEYPATIIDSHKKKVQVMIDDARLVNRESTRAIHLAQALSKGDRMEFVIQKAVELGVASITPLVTERSVVRLDADREAKKHAQWQHIMISACEQSGRNQLPTLHPVCHLDQYLRHCCAPSKWVLSPDGESPLQSINDSVGDVALLIGPEGGFHPVEVQKAKAALFETWRLGPRILRTETAALAALSILQAINGDLFS
jgi:16S rRNA (uracil1498-N3)-methyltransferase